MVWSVIFYPQHKLVAVSSTDRYACTQGFNLLAKMGWAQGQGLGKERQGLFCSSLFITQRAHLTVYTGRVDPIMAKSAFQMGLGKWERDVEVLDSTVLSKKAMNSFALFIGGGHSEEPTS